VTYFHTTMGKMNKGPLTSFRKLFAKYDLDRQQRLVNLNVIHPGFYMKTRISLFRCAVNNLLLRKCHMFDSILAFFESIKGDNVLSQRIIGVLPNEIHQVYLSEREYACKLSSLIDYRKSSKIRHFKQFKQGTRDRQPSVSKRGHRTWR